MFCKECITARKKFRKGDKVVLSVEGCTHMPDMIKYKSTGEVTGFGRNYNLVRVRIDGQKYPTTYHAGFWERINA